MLMLILFLFFGSISVIFLLSDHFPFLDNDIVILGLSLLFASLPIVASLLKDSKLNSARYLNTLIPEHSESMSCATEDWIFLKSYNYEIFAGKSWSVGGSTLFINENRSKQLSQIIDVFQIVNCLIYENSNEISIQIKKSFLRDTSTDGSGMDGKLIKESEIFSETLFFDSSDLQVAKALQAYLLRNN